MFELLKCNFMHKPYTTRACAAPAVRVSPRLGGDAEVAGGAAARVVVARGSADLRRAVADVIVVERVALEWEGMIDGEKQILFHEGWVSKQSQLMSGDFRGLEWGQVYRR